MTAEDVLSAWRRRRRKWGTARQSSVWTPPDSSNLVGWWDAAAIVGLVDGDPVATWADRSGKGLDASQSTASERPTYKVGQLNGLPGVLFEGDYLKTASVSQDDGIFTTFIVGYGNGMLWANEYSSAIPTRGHYLYRNGNMSSVSYNNVQSAYDANSDTWQDAPQKIIEQGCDGTHAGHIVLVNGAAVAKTVFANGDPGSNVVENMIGIGAKPSGSFATTGYIHEMMLWKSALTADQRTSVRSYLSTKWGIAV